VKQAQVRFEREKNVEYQRLDGGCRSGVAKCEDEKIRGFLWRQARRYVKSGTSRQMSLRASVTSGLAFAIGESRRKSMPASSDSRVS